jgi:menaquinone-specific isochorismate synthase
VSSKIYNPIQPAVTKGLAQAKRLGFPIVLSYTFEFEVSDLLPLITHSADKNKTRIYWEQPKDNIAVAGIGTVWYRDINKDNTFVDIQKSISLILNNSISFPNKYSNSLKVFGGHSFNLNEEKKGVWGNFPQGRFSISECLIVKNETNTLITISRTLHPSDVETKVLQEFQKTCEHYKNRLPVTLKPIQKTRVEKSKNIPGKNTYLSSVNLVLEKLNPSDIEKVVISRVRHLNIYGDFKDVSALQVLRENYPNCTTFMFSYPKSGTFLGSTPEHLITLKDGLFSTEALAGTIARGRNMEEDRLHAESLFNSHKEREEHRFVVDQIVNKLRSFSNNVNFGDKPVVFKLNNVQHLKTPISGSLKNGSTVLDMILSLHPTPAIAGTPTKQATEVIAKIETHNRGWYSGPVGWIDKNGDGEFCVALRSAFAKDNKVYVFAGSGIVSESLPEKEWEETELKFQPIVSALSGGQS